MKADLLALRNLGRSREGREVLLAQAIVIVCLVVASLALSSGILLTEKVVSALRDDRSGAALRLFFALTLVLPLLLVFGAGVSQLARELYRAPHLRLLLTAPISSLAILRLAFLRTLGGWLVFGLAVGLPPVLGLVYQTPIPATAALAFPIAFLSLAAPIVALQVLLKVALVRWLSSPRLRRLLTVVHVLVCIGLAALVGFGILNARMLSNALGTWLATGIELPWILDAPAALIAASAGFDPGAGLLWSNLLWLAGALPPLLLAAAWYRRSFEVHLVTVDKVQRAGRRSWPATPLASFLRKAWIGSMRVKSNLAFFTVVILIMVVLLDHIGREAPVGEDRFPAVLREAFLVLSPWLGLNILIASLAFLGMVGDEQQQIGVLATAPFARRHFLHSKLITVASPFVFTLLATVVGAPVLAGLEPGSIGVFVLVAIPMLLYTLGVIAVFGTWPSMIRIHENVPLASNLRSVVPVLAIGALLTAVIFAMIKARFALSASYHGHGALSGMDATTAAWLVLGVVWAGGLFVFAVGYAVGLANLRRVLGPQPS